jgi:hypothetical protein
MLFFFCRTLYKDMNGYKLIHIGRVPDAKVKRAAKTKKLSLTASELKGNKTLLVHPANYSRIKKAQAKGAGVQGLEFSEPEMMADIEYHRTRGAGMEGGSLWDIIKKGAKFVKDSGIGTILADTAQTLATPILGETGSKIAREAARSVLGVGIKEKMAKVRAARKKSNKPLGGSFLIN